MFERLKTNSKIIAADIIRGRALPETILPQNRNHVGLVITHPDGSVDYVDGYNSRTAAGSLWQATVMGSAVGAPALYVALSTTLISAAIGDTVLIGEIPASTSPGLARHAGTYQNPVAATALTGAGSSASYQIYNLFTSDGTYTVQSAALFNAPGPPPNGILFVEAVLSPAATLASGDSVALTWSVNL